MAIPCEICDSNATYDSDQPCIMDKHPYEIFHSNCDTCHDESSCPDHLCHFCQHLRLRHLCFCDFGGFPRNISVRFGNFFTFSSKNGCKFCHFIWETLQSGPIPWLSHDAEQLASVKVEIDFLREGIYPSYRRLAAEIRYWWHDTELGCHICGSMNVYSLDLAPISPSRQLAPRSVLCPWKKLVEPATLNDMAQDFANWGKIRQWTREEFYQSEPSSSTSSYTEPPPPVPTSSHSITFSTSFRVIDVQKRCLVRGMPDAGFVALSYIWGPNPNPDMWTTRKTLVEELEREGGITRSKTPKTIEDAMFICDKLDQRYLWADRLCIIQDDDETKKHQIKSMGSIFASANFTIAVLDGTVDSGIPGVGFSRHNRRKHHQISGITFVYEHPDVQETINASTWATRGWTYQEAVLSKRVLYFSDSEAFLEHKYYFMAENGFGRLSAPFNIPHRLLHHLLEKSAYNTFHIWKHHLAEYTKRKLTNNSDVYDAFSGISSLLYGGADENFLYGLPRPIFNQAILWYPKRSTNHITRPMVRNPGAKGYPTWSWGSITGPICYSAHSQWMGNLVRWIANPTKPGTTLRYLGVSTNEPLAEEEGHILICLAIAWSFGCIEANWPFMPLSESTFDEMEINLLTLIDKPDSLVQKLYEILPAHATKPAELKEAYGEIPEGLATRAQTAILKVKSHEESGHDHEGGHKLEILNDMGECIGILDSEDPSVQDGLVWSPEGRADIECMGISLERRWKIDCLVPGSYSALDKAKKFPELNLTFSDKLGSFLEYPYWDATSVPVVSVIAIRWQGPHVYRASLGWIVLTKWVKVERNFHDVILR